MNSQDANARNFLYHEIPEHYSWEAKNKKWKKRKRNSETIGRIAFVSPELGELYYLRLLLLHVKGPTSFDHIKVVNDIQYPNYQDTCYALGLLQHDRECFDTL
eukprot:Pgem_evm1s12180